MVPENNRISSSQEAMVQTTIKGLGNLIKLLPSGTFFLFLCVNPVVTNNGKCTTFNRYLSGLLLGVCGFSCCFSWFTDSYVDSNGVTQYGVVTKEGLFPFSDFNSESQNLSSYKLRLGDFVHAFLSIIVFAIVALLDTNTVSCFYPSFEASQNGLIMALPPIVGALASCASIMFPNVRHGIGYPPSKL